jgi:hypothetical protein
VDSREPDKSEHQPRDPGTSPAIWIYAEKPQDITLTLSFGGAGFMTDSTPNYNQAWRIHVDPKPPFYRHSPLFGQHRNSYAYLDYDGFRDGQFQKEHGWCVAQDKLLGWQRTHLREIGFLESEIDDVNYTYGRMLLERRYRAPLFAIYPQEGAIVNSSVSLGISPSPESLYRLWLYFVPVHAAPDGLKVPHLPKVIRRGLTVVELAYLTDREIPGHDKRLVATCAGRDVHDRH